jgi:hypothetical protein
MVEMTYVTVVLGPAEWKWPRPLGPFGPGQNKGNPPLPTGE